MLTRKTKKVLAIVLTGAVALPGMASGTLVSAKAKCTTKKMTLQAGEKKTIKIKGKVKKAKYMFKSSKPSIAKVNKKGTVTAKKAGKAVITITEKKKAKKKIIGKVNVIVKNKINVIIFFFSSNMLLSRYKRIPFPQLHEKFLNMRDNSLLQFTFCKICIRR